MKTRSLLLPFVAVMASTLLACTTSRRTPVQTPSSYTLDMALIKDAPSDRYVDLDYGIRLTVKDARSNIRILTKYDASAITLPTVHVRPELVSFVSESTRRYMRTMGFKFDADVSSDYMMTLSIKEYNVGYLSGIGWSATVQLNVEVHDRNRTLVYPNVVAVGRSNIGGGAGDVAGGAAKALNTAYATALEDIDWDRIAYFLKRSSHPEQEKNKQVRGDGNTALEHLTIHWDVNSRPQGADISWRIISSTPEVKNQNYRYLNTSPYESTETFDIKGLTFNNAGNVQVEIKCEKSGYYTQSKRFNCTSVLEEKEISAFFRLVPEE